MTIRPVPVALHPMQRHSQAGTIVTRAAAQSFNSGVPANVSFDTVLRDDEDWFDPGTPTFLTLPHPGLYAVTCWWEWDLSALAGEAIGTLLGGGGVEPSIDEHEPANANYRRALASVFVTVAPPNNRVRLELAQTFANPHDLIVAQLSAFRLTR